MRRRDFVELLERLGELTPQQKSVVIRHLGDRQDSTGRGAASELPAPTRCPRCQARQERVGSWGQSHGLKRYRCKDCGRTFNALTGTPLAHLRKREQWGRYAQALIEGVSVREAARRCRIDKNTAATAFCIRQPGIRRNTKRASSRLTRPSSWNPSRASGTCRVARVTAAASPASEGSMPSRSRCSWCATEVGRPPTSNYWYWMLPMSPRSCAL